MFALLISTIFVIYSSPVDCGAQDKIPLVLLAHLKESAKPPLQSANSSLQSANPPLQSANPPLQSANQPLQLANQPLLVNTPLQSIRLNTILSFDQSAGQRYGGADLTGAFDAVKSYYVRGQVQEIPEDGADYYKWPKKLKNSTVECENITTVLNKVVSVLKNLQQFEKSISKDECGQFGEQVVSSMREISSANARAVLKQIINNALLDAQEGKFDNLRKPSAFPSHSFRRFEGNTAVPYRPTRHWYDTTPHFYKRRTTAPYRASGHWYDTTPHFHKSRTTASYHTSRHWDDATPRFHKRRTTASYPPSRHWDDVTPRFHERKTTAPYRTSKHN